MNQSRPAEADSDPSTQRFHPALGLGLLIALVGYTTWVHYGIGPVRQGFEHEWTTPSAFLFKSPWMSGLIGTPWLAFTSLFAPAVLFAGGVFTTARSALMRAVALACVIATALFLFYGLVGPATWRFFGWRASAVLILIAIALGSAFASPFLAARWLSLRWPMRVLTYFPFVAFALGFLRNATGTNSNLPFAISPWPAVPIFGLEVGALFVAIVFATAAIGLYALGQRSPRQRIIGIAAALGFPAVWLWFEGTLGLLPFQASIGLAIVLALVSVAVVAAASIRQPTRIAIRAQRFALAAGLVVTPLAAGQAWSYADYSYTRNVLTRQITDGLAQHLEREGLYPDDLETLVASGDIEAIPIPVIGFGKSNQTRFYYHNFGTSFLLEFTATRWVQCAYTPPVLYDDEEERREAALEFGPDAGKESWSCPSRPPELW